MARTIGIGCQSYKELIENNAFYIDKTLFIKEWWENFDSVTLITRPRRFGKTLNMSMVEQFFSIDYAGLVDKDGTIFGGWYDMSRIHICQAARKEGDRKCQK